MLLLTVDIIALVVSRAAGQALQDRIDAGTVSNVRRSIDYDICLFGSGFERSIVIEVTNSSMHSRISGFESFPFVLAPDKYLERRQRVLRVKQIQHCSPNVPSSADSKFRVLISRRCSGLLTIS